MMINAEKYTLSANNMEEEELNYYSNLFPFEIKAFEVGLKYLGFHLKQIVIRRRTGTSCFPR
jgi:hypothetical protein